MWTQETQRAECSNLKKSAQMHEHYNSSFQGLNSPFLSEPPLPKANLKSYPLFLRAIQIGACKLSKTV